VSRKAPERIRAWSGSISKRELGSRPTVLSPLARSTDQSPSCRVTRATPFNARIARSESSTGSRSSWVVATVAAAFVRISASARARSASFERRVNCVTSTLAPTEKTRKALSTTTSSGRATLRLCLGTMK
jgi:hypothetical protein